MRRTPFYAALAAAGMAIAVTAYAATPAQGEAEQACAKHGVQPRSAAWELCLRHVTRAYEWGERGMLEQPAFPVRFGPAARPVAPARIPSLGEHTHEILAALGFDANARDL